MSHSDYDYLLNYKTYEDYLDSFLNKQDLQYLNNASLGRYIAELGYRSHAETMSREDFNYRRAAVKEFHNKSRGLHKLFHHGCALNDNFLHELAMREKANRVGLISTIIFLRLRRKTGFEISGYIDYQSNLKRSRNREEGCVDWEAVFAGKKLLWPTKHDLGYYNWRTCESVSNDTVNYEVISDPLQGLLFLNRHDRRTIYTDPLVRAGKNTVKVNISSAKYPHAIFFDHYVRK